MSEQIHGQVNCENITNIPVIKIEKNNMKKIFIFIAFCCFFLEIYFFEYCKEPP